MEESDDKLSLLLSEASEFMMQKLGDKQRLYSFDFSSDQPISEGRYQWSVPTSPPSSSDDSNTPDET